MSYKNQLKEKDEISLRNMVKSDKREGGGDHMFCMNFFQ